MVVHKQKRKNIKQQIQLHSKVSDINSLFTTLRILRKIWQFLGVVPMMGTSKILIRSQWIWSFCLLVITFITCFCELNHVIKYGTTVTKGFYSTEMIFYKLIASTIFYISFVKKTKFLKIYNKFISLYEQMKIFYGSDTRTDMPIYRKFKREVWLLSFIHFIFYTFCISINIVHFRSTPAKLFRILCAYYIPNILISANLCLFWMASRFTSLSHLYMNTILKSSQVLLQTSQTSFTAGVYYISSSLWYQREFSTFNSKKSLKFLDIFLTLTEIRTNLDQLMREVVDLFSTVLLLNFGNSFMILAIHYFAIYKYFDSSNVGTPLMFSLKFARLLMHMFNIIFVLLSHGIIIKEKCNTIHILNRLPVESADMEKHINKYLLQLMVRKHAVSVSDIFELDLTFVLSISSTLLAYVIFLIQIDLGAVSMEGKIATNAC